jgi:hypothetical protein
METERNRELRRARGLLLGTSILCLGLAAAVVYLLFVRVAPAVSPPADPALRKAALARLVSLSEGIWDTFPDPDVGRVLQPDLHEREAFGSPVSSNPFGWRERPVAIPKPPGTVRIVFLGDSFVFGPGIAAADRLGYFLESYIKERAGRKPARVEAVHIGMSSWNIRAESAYLRRNLTNLAPDLVVQIAVSNDLDDSGSSRGFGAVADFTPQRPGQTSMIYDFYPIWGLGFPGKVSYLNAGLSHEARQRYVENAQWLATLDRGVAATGGEYLFVLNWADQPKTAARYLPAALPQRSVLYLPDSFRRDLRFRISDSDPHWTRAGYEHLAKFFYGGIRDRKMLKSLELAPWPEAEEVFRQLNSAGLEEADLATPLDSSAWSSQIGPALDFRHLTAAAAAQVYGGVGPDGLVAPYASVLLNRQGGTRVRIEGGALPAREIQGTEVRVFADEIELGKVTLEPDSPFALTYALPAEVLKRPFFDVRFQSADWVYTGPNLRRCVVFRLDRVEALP